MSTRSGLLALALVFTAVIMSCDQSVVGTIADRNPYTLRFESLEEALKNPGSAETLVVVGDTAATLPIQLKMLPILKYLRWQKGHLTAIPSFIGDLQTLCTMNISYNDIDTISPEIGKLTNVNLLDVSSNNLSYLPDEICNMEGLEHLSLNNNNLTVLPDSIQKLKKLWYLQISNNRISREEIERVRKALPNLTWYRHD